MLSINDAFTQKQQNMEYTKQHSYILHQFN